MAVISVKPGFDESGDSDSESYRFSEEYIVVCDSYVDGVYEVLESLPVREGDPHRTGKSICVSRDVERDGESLKFIATVNYDKDETADDNTSGGNEDPAKKPEIAFTSQQTIIARAIDYLGSPILNSAADPFEKADEVEVSRAIITITHRLVWSKVTESLLEEWRDTVHAPQLFGKFTQDPRPHSVLAAHPKFFEYVKGTVRLLDFGASTEQQGRDTVWNVSLVFSVADSWLGTALDEGLYQADATINTLSQGQAGDIVIQNRTPILDDIGFPVARPVLLNGGGGKLTNGRPWWRVWPRYRHDDLNLLLQALGLPTSLSGYRLQIA